jgi:glycerophosphoryl diester phosphodiesterase
MSNRTPEEITTMADTQIVGHRGAKGEAPENTVVGFTYARSLGLTGVEFDVRLSKDHQLVVIHDATVDRTTDGSGSVSAFTAAELGALDARGTCPSWPERVGVPTLGEALEVIATFPLAQFEIKADAPERMERIAEGIVSEIRARSLEAASLVTSFDVDALEIMQRLAPDIRRAFIGRADDPEIVETALRLGCVQANLHQFRQTSAALVAKAHAAGLRVGGGPCDTVEDFTIAREWGMDGVTSDLPSDLLATRRAV